MNDAKFKFDKLELGRGQEKLVLNTIARDINLKKIINKNQQAKMKQYFIEKLKDRK